MIFFPPPFNLSLVPSNCSIFLEHILYTIYFSVLNWQNGLNISTFPISKAQSKFN